MVETCSLSEGVDLRGLHAVVALVGPSIDESYFRVDGAVKVLESQDDDCALLLAGGEWTLSRGEQGANPAAAMQDYAVKQREIKPERTAVVSGSRVTIEDACNVKGHIEALPKSEAGSERPFALAVVTSASHLRRAAEGFGHVMGEGYDVHAVSAGDFPARSHQGAYELGARALEWAVLLGTEAGDDAAIKARLPELVPGYDPNRSLIKVMAKHAIQIGPHAAQQLKIAFS